MNRSKPLLVHSLKHEIKALMSTQKKQLNHYETLNVEQNCTQEDIKSAYYELSKKYHPDRNTSSEAKTKFQNVSDAYEVLGNFQKRRMYDRDLMARGPGAVRNIKYTVEEDKLAGFHRSRKSNYSTSYANETTRNFDFDAWTKAHYGYTLRRTLEKKRNLDEKIRLRNEIKQQEENDSLSTSMMIVFGIFLLGCYVQVYLFNYDQNLIAKRRENKKS